MDHGPDPGDFLASRRAKLSPSAAPCDVAAAPIATTCPPCERANDAKHRTPAPNGPTTPSLEAGGTPVHPIVEKMRAAKAPTSSTVDAGISLDSTTISAGSSPL